MPLISRPSTVQLDIHIPTPVSPCRERGLYYFEYITRSRVADNDPAACGIDSMCLNQDEAAMRIRARPLPAPSKGFAPRRSERPLTETKEFRLTSQARHERAEMEFMERVSREEEQARRASEVIRIRCLF